MQYRRGTRARPSFTTFRGTCRYRNGTMRCSAVGHQFRARNGLYYFGAEMLQVREVPFAFLTGSEGDEIESRYAKIPVLRKPFSEMEIESCLRRLMANSGMPAL